jgi:superfamily II DNA or RNA helicase
MRWFVEQELRVLIIVPSTQLVHQMKGDFTDYSSHNGFDVDGNTNLIMSGKEKHLNNLVTLSTWQSLQLDRVNSGWLNSYDVIMVDECHQAGSKELSNLMSKATDVKYRFGFTGSLGKSKTNHMVIKGLFGPVSKVTTTKKLIEDGHLSKIEIMCLVLQYPPEIKSLFSSKVEYPKEVEFITSYERRNKFIRNLALSLEGNTLILYNFVEKHGEVLYDLIKEKAGDRPVHFIHGGVESEERDEVRAIIEGSSNSITVASLGTMSVGVNVKRLHNVILAHPTKSAIRIIQSIGRGLRLADGKTHLSLYDISDKLSKSKTKSNHTYRHFIERLSIYSQEEFDYKIVEVDIG